MSFFNETPKTKKLQGFTEVFYDLMLNYVKAGVILIATKLEVNGDYTEYVFHIKKTEIGEFIIISGKLPEESSYGLEVFWDDPVNCWFFDLECFVPNSDILICTSEGSEIAIPKSLMRMFYWDGFLGYRQLTPGEVFTRMYCENGQIVGMLETTVAIACDD